MEPKGVMRELGLILAGHGKGGGGAVHSAISIRNTVEPAARKSPTVAAKSVGKLTSSWSVLGQSGWRNRLKGG